MAPPPLMRTFAQPNFGGFGGGKANDFSELPTVNDFTKSAQPDLYGWLRGFQLPELKYQTGLRGPITDTFMNYISGGPGGAMGSAKTAAEGYGADLFRVGGPLQSSILRAMGGMAGRGFQPGGAEGQTNAITREGVRDVGNFFSSQAVPLASQYFNTLAGGFGQANQNISELLSSLFTGGANIQQLLMAMRSMPKKGLLGLGLGPF